MSTAPMITATRARLAATAVALMALVAATQVGRLAIVQQAAGIPEDADGLGKFVNAADGLVTPVLVAVAAIAPFALIASGVMLMFGNRRGWGLLGASLGGLVLIGSAKGLIA